MTTRAKQLVKALRDAERALARVRSLLGDDEGEPDDELFARRMLSVLREVDIRGGRVRRDELLDIGEAFGYGRRGMAGFYQELLRREGDDAVLTDEGRARLEHLRSRYEELSPPPMSHPFWKHAFPEDRTSGPWVRWALNNDRPGSEAEPYSAEDAKRELYKTWS